MKEETRFKSVPYTVFISDDGQEFDNMKDCTIHDRLIRGEIKICDECQGKGYVTEIEEWESYHDGKIERFEREKKCECCNGKGYLEKKEVWI